MLSLNLIENCKKIQQISRSASSEHALQQCLENIIQKWEKKEFQFRKGRTIEIKKEKNDLKDVG